MRIPQTEANGLEARDWDSFKQDVNDFFTDLFSPVCKKFPKTLGCPKPQPAEPDPVPPPTVPDPPNTPNHPNPPNPPSPPGNPTPPGQAPPVTTTRASNPVQTTPPANPPPAATTTPAPAVPTRPPAQNPGNGNDGDGNGNDGNGNGNGNDNGNGGGTGGGNGNGNGNTDPGSESPNPNPDPTPGGDPAPQPQPTTTRTGPGSGRPQNLGGNVLLVASETASGPRPTSFADSQSDISDELGVGGEDDPAPGPAFNNNPNGPGPGRVLVDSDSGTQSPPTKADGGSNSNTPDYGNGSGYTGHNDDDNGKGGGIPGGGNDGPNPTNPENSNAGPSPLPGIIGAVVSLIVLLLVLLALLYKYRRTRRVQSFLHKFTPFKVAPYSKLDRKRSSMGSDLMFGCRGEEEPYSDEKRPWSTNYGSMHATPFTDVTHPPVVARRSLRHDGPPVLDIDISLANSTRSASPTSDFEPSPLSPSYPNMQTPPAARHSPRSSQDTVGGFSIASSGVFDPSLISWPIPPSTANSAMSPPGTANTANTYDTGPIIVGRSTPTRYKPIQPAPPSNWQRPKDWSI